MARTRSDETTRALLQAPLHMTSVGWGSRDIADELGISQSMVVRVWNATYAPADGGAALPHDDLRVVAVRLTRGSSLVVLEGVGDAAPLPGPFMRSVRRPALQTLLAADLVRGSRGRPDGDAADRQGDEDLVRSLASDGGRELVVLTRTPLPGLGGVRVQTVDDETAWQALLGPLVRATSRQPVSELRALQLRVMEWARTRRSRLEWVRDDGPTAAPSSTPTHPRPLTDTIAEEAFHLVLARVSSGQLAAGDRVTETSLLRGLRTSRTYVREAVRSLAAQGLIELEPHRGAVVPVPRVDDVTDTYAARRAMGALLVERAALSAVRDLAPAERALAEMLAIAETGDARACGDADLRFQDALAGATSMRHLPGMFRTLTSHVLLLTTVMGLRYVYSIPRMCRDDAAILAAVSRRDADGAVARWHAKIDHALTHMATQL